MVQIWEQYGAMKPVLPRILSYKFGAFSTAIRGTMCLVTIFLSIICLHPVPLFFSNIVIVGVSRLLSVSWSIRVVERPTSFHTRTIPRCWKKRTRQEWRTWGAGTGAKSAGWTWSVERDAGEVCCKSAASLLQVCCPRPADALSCESKPAVLNACMNLRDNYINDGWHIAYSFCFRKLDTFDILLTSQVSELKLSADGLIRNYSRSRAAT